MSEDKEPVVCPECGTRTMVRKDEAENIVRLHNEKRHGGEDVAGVGLIAEGSKHDVPSEPPELPSEKAKQGRFGQGVDAYLHEHERRGSMVCLYDTRDPLAWIDSNQIFDPEVGDRGDMVPVSEAKRVNENQRQNE